MTESIEISNKTKNELDQLISNADYDNVISKLLKLIPVGDDEGEYSSEFRLELLNAKLEVIEGDLVDHNNVKEILGIMD
jgi:hypothetical protein